MGAPNSRQNLQYVFQINCLWIIHGAWLNDCISNTRLDKKYGSVLIFRVIIRERLRWLGHIVWMKDERLPKIVLFEQLSGATWKAGCPFLRWEDVINKDLKEIGTF